MTKYLKIAPDPDAHVCHCGDGNPDCDHWESCDACGMDYRKHEGHDCIDGVPVQDLRALAKELRDSLDACETERDRLRAQIAALQSVPQGVEVPEIPVDVLSSIEQDHSCEEWDWRAPAITAWFRRNARNPAVRVEVPPYPDVLVRQSIGHTERHAGIMEGVEWARKNARIVPTPPQPLQPEERRVGPDEVVVPRSAAEYAILAFDWIDCPDPEHYEALRSFHDALRTSAQAPGQRGEG